MMNDIELECFAQVLYLPDHRRKNYINNEMMGELYITSSIAETYALVVADMGYALIPSCYVSQDQSISAIPIQDSEVIPYGIYMHKGMIFPALRTFASFYNEALMKGKRI